VITAVLFVNAHMLVIDRVSLLIAGAPLPITLIIPMQSLLQGAPAKRNEMELKIHNHHQTSEGEFIVGAAERQSLVQGRRYLSAARPHIL
jgi:hypothetical protein